MTHSILICVLVAEARIVVLRRSLPVTRLRKLHLAGSNRALGAVSDHNNTSDVNLRLTEGNLRFII